MDYISIQEASKLWNIDPSNIGKLCRKGKIEGARIVARNWLIPKDTPRPIDGRTKYAKTNESLHAFRFPLFVNSPLESYTPSLTQEETKLHLAQINFYSCEYKEAELLFEELAKSAQDIYVKICAYFYMCILSAIYDSSINWENYYFGLNLLLSNDFPYKKEMELFLPLLDLVIGKFKNIPENFNTDFSYEYHPSAWYINVLLSIFNFDNKTNINNPKILEPFETLCHMMEHDSYYIEAQKLHAILFVYHFGLQNEEEMQYHLHKVIKIGYEHNLLFSITDLENYYSEETNIALSEYPSSFIERIHKNSKIIADNYSRFASKNIKTSVYERLSKSDYRYVFYAIEGYTNKQVAAICNVSERTIAKRYNDIYDKLGIFSKQELISQMDIAFGSKKHLVNN